MRVRYIQEWNTATSYVAVGTERDVEASEAAALINGGIAEPVEPPVERAVKAAPRKSAKK